MKQSTFKKTIQVNGKKPVIGEIIVTMNYSTKVIKGTNSFTHDDYTKSIPIHKIELLVDGKIWDRSLELDSEEMVEKEVVKQTVRLTDHLNMIANMDKSKTFGEKMQELGFN